MAKFQCIECGSEIDTLYRDYKGGSIKISRCKVCDKVADKYVEYDPVVILLDALLLQRQAYTHLLINTKSDSPWHLALLLWICDAFSKLVLQRSELSNKGLLGEHPINYSYLGLELYLNYIIAASELLTLLATVLVVFFIKRVLHHRHISINSKLITRAVIVANLGRVLAIPALLWGQSYGQLYSVLCQGYVCLSSVQALRVVSEGNHGTLWAVLAVTLGFTTQFVVSNFLHTWLDHK
ncbi:protein ARV1-like [Elysia marginata]|uniref:Protein ARV n=1 Tax=Elysia marginata TaxID=1093978 RepID=A0AAV4IDD1_9GAST|nr:protein ARV1-like [Elysia marginata]